jgi:hypothetical protein
VVRPRAAGGRSFPAGAALVAGSLALGLFVLKAIAIAFLHQGGFAARWLGGR